MNSLFKTLADNPSALLRWYVDVGVDEAITEEPVDRFKVGGRVEAVVATKQAKTVSQSHSLHSGLQPEVGELVHSAIHLAKGANTIDELKAAVESFEGCGLKKFASSTVFADGNASARIMFIGEAPGADEDRQGKPFVGASGKLLDKMLESIGLDRETNAYITNIVFWRPPGNRSPTHQEVSSCLPFVQRHIELLDPGVLVFVGGLSAKTLLAKPNGITKMRGHWHEYVSPSISKPVPSMALFHPAYLLRSPQQKRLAWQDLIAIRHKLNNLVQV